MTVYAIRTYVECVLTFWTVEVGVEVEVDCTSAVQCAPLGYVVCLMISQLWNFPPGVVLVLIFVEQQGGGGGGELPPLSPAGNLEGEIQSCLPLRLRDHTDHISPHHGGCSINVWPDAWCIIDSKVHQINILLVGAIVKPRKPDTAKLLLSKAGEGGQGSYRMWHNGDGDCWLGTGHCHNSY